MKNQSNKPMVVESKREAWVDWAKALLMLFVVVGHAGLRHDLFLNLIYSFHMPAFFIISGYLYNPHPWKKTTLHFLVPIVFCSILSLGFYTMQYFHKNGVFDPLYVWNNSWQSILGVPSPGSYTLFVGIWFIIILWLCRMIMGDIIKSSCNFIHRNILVLISICIMVALLEGVYDFVPYDVELLYLFRLPYMLPFFLIGYFYKQNKNYISNVISRFSLRQRIITGLILFISFTIFNGYVEIYGGIYGDNVIVFFINAMASSYLFFKMCSLFKARRFVVVFSKGTFFILGTHYLLLTIIGHMVRFNDGVIYPWLCGILIFCLLYYPIKFCINKCPILLGK